MRGNLANYFKVSDGGDKSDLSWLSSATLVPVGVVEHPETTNPKKPKVPKDILPSKNASMYLKNVRFSAYKSTHPDLLAEMTHMELTGMQALRAEFGENIPETSRIELASKILERFIEESTLYKTILRSCKDQYDHAISALTEKVDSYAGFDEQLEQKDKAHSEEVKKATGKLTERIDELESKLHKLQKNEKCVNVEVQALTTENIRLTNLMQAMQKELEASKTTCSTLATSLNRMSEEKLKYEALDSAKSLELAQTKQSETMLRSELEM
jgi:chromosome segregation ATPase